MGLLVMGFPIPVLVLCLLLATADSQVHGGNQYWPTDYYAPSYVEGGGRVYSGYNGGSPGYYQPPNPPYKPKTTSRMSTTTATEDDDLLDFMYRRAEMAQEQLKATKEQVKTLLANMNRQSQALADMRSNTLPSLQNTDGRQTDILNSVKDELADVQDDVTNRLDLRVSELRDKNSAVSADQKTAENTATELRATDIAQQAHIAELDSKIQALLNPVNRELVNSGFPLAAEEAEVLDTRLTALQAADSRSVCENGQVTLDAEDRRAEVQFQRAFVTLPRLVHGLCGFRFDLRSPQDSTAAEEGEEGADPNRGHSSDRGYPGGYPRYRRVAVAVAQAPKGRDQDASIGMRVSGVATGTGGATFELFDLSFGDPEVRSVDVCFQACTAA